MTELPLTGGCNGGAVRFEVTEPLAGASYCHCKRCQRRSGVGERAPSAGLVSDRRRREQASFLEARRRRREVVLRRLRLVTVRPY
jgi:hypothetical protein